MSLTNSKPKASDSNPRTRNGKLSVQKILGEKISQRKRRSKRPRWEDEDRIMLENAQAAVKKEVACDIIKGQLVLKYSPLEADMAMFEISTTKGVFVVIRSRSGEHTIIQKHDAPTR